MDMDTDPNGPMGIRIQEASDYADPDLKCFLPYLSLRDWPKSPPPSHWPPPNLHLLQD